MITFNQYMEARVKGPALKANVKSKINKAIHKLTAGKYFKAIPLDELIDIMKQNGVVVLQEDSTEFSGFLTGSDGRMDAELASADSKDKDGFYTPYGNAMFLMTWHRMESRNYEVVAYVT